VLVATGWGVRVVVAGTVPVTVARTGVAVLINIVWVLIGYPVAIGVLVEVKRGASVGCSV
jgi:hypothetical protein